MAACATRGATPALDRVSPETVSQRMDMYYATASVLLGDASRFQFSIRNSQHTHRDIEHPVATFATSDPFQQFGSKVRSDSQYRSLPVLFVAVIQFDEWNIAQ